MIDLEKILQAKENLNIEAKRARGGLPQSIWETYSSFANTAGGVILLGVEEDVTAHAFTPVGVDNPEKMISDIWNTLNAPSKVSANILFNHHLYAVKYPYNGKVLDVVVMEVPKADRHQKPVYIGQDVFKGAYRRNGEGDYRCKREEVLSMLRDQTEESPDAKLLENLKIEDLCNDSVRRYRIMFSNLKPNHAWTKLDDEEFLCKIGACRRGEDGEAHSTLGGLIFFGEFVTIMTELPHYFLDYREKLRDDTRWTDRVCSGDGDWSGNIFDFYFRIIDRLTADIKVPFKLTGGLIREDETQMHTALREALANALIHADYYGRQGIVIEKRFREIRIYNPGLFRISIDDAIAGGISDARNATIFNMFSLIRIGERSGTGLCDMFNIWKENGLVEPIITETLDPERVVLILQVEMQNEGVNEGVNEGAKLNTTHKAILAVLKKNCELTAQQIADEIGKSKQTVERSIKFLKDNGFIKREGSDKNGSWLILR